METLIQNHYPHELLQPLGVRHLESAVLALPCRRSRLRARACDKGRPSSPRPHALFLHLELSACHLTRRPVVPGRGPTAGGVTSRDFRRFLDGVGFDPSRPIVVLGGVAQIAVREQVVGEPSLPHCIDDVGKRTARKARLCHDVVFLGNAKRGLTQEVLGASHVHRVPDRPKACGGMPEPMQVYRKSESLFGASAHGVIASPSIFAKRVTVCSPPDHGRF